MQDDRQRFHVAVHRARGGYFARVLEIPGCVARGESEIEAIENVRATVRVFMAVGKLLSCAKPTVRVEISA